MNRAFFLTMVVLVIDQLLKRYFQLNFNGRTVMLFGDFGFTYTTNPGIWIKQDISNFSMLIVQVIAILLAIFAHFLLKYYQTFYRKSLLVDLAFAFFVTAAIGNVIIDRFTFGYIRDYFINPIATSNLAC